MGVIYIEPPQNFLNFGRRPYESYTMYDATVHSVISNYIHSRTEYGLYIVNTQRTIVTMYGGNFVRWEGDHASTAPKLQPNRFRTKNYENIE